MARRKFIKLKTDVVPERVTREQYEDYFHTVISMMLPNIPKSSIRPSYQQGANLAALTETQPDNTTVTTGINEKDTLIYFKVIFGNQLVEPHTNKNGTILQQRIIEVKLEIYGMYSSQICLLVNSLIRADYVLQYLNSTNMFLYDVSDYNEVHEFINGLWYERHDITLKFNESLNIEVPVLPELAQSADIYTNNSDTPINIQIQEH